MSVLKDPSIFLDESENRWGGIFDVSGLKDGLLDLVTSPALWVRIANDYLFFSSIVVQRDLKEVFGIDFTGSHLGSVWANGQGRMRTEQAAYSSHRARVLYEEAPGEQLAHGFWYIICCDEVVRI